MSDLIVLVAYTKKKGQLKLFAVLLFAYTQKGKQRDAICFCACIRKIFLFREFFVSKKCKTQKNSCLYIEKLETMSSVEHVQV